MREQSIAVKASGSRPKGKRPDTNKRASGPEQEARTSIARGDRRRVKKTQEAQQNRQEATREQVSQEATEEQQGQEARIGKRPHNKEQAAPRRLNRQAAETKSKRLEKNRRASGSEGRVFEEEVLPEELQECREFRRMEPSGGAIGVE